VKCFTGVAATVRAMFGAVSGFSLFAPSDAAKKNIASDSPCKRCFKIDPSVLDCQNAAVFVMMTHINYYDNDGKLVSSFISRL